MDVLSFDMAIDARYRGQLQALAKRLHPEFTAAEPYPHAVIDNLFDDRVLSEIVDAFPEEDWPNWREFATPEEDKLGTRDASLIPPKILSFLALLNSAPFVEFLETLTGVHGLIPDPYFDGGGLHKIVRGGRLEIHADFNRHRKMKLDRRINLLIYLNKDWREDYGGHLELWDRGMTACQRKVLPTFNRTVFFCTTDFTYHGHPEPLRCPADMARRSLALYYFSNGRPDDETSGSHSTLFKCRPGSTTGTSPKRQPDKKPGTSPKPQPDKTPTAPSKRRPGKAPASPFKHAILMCVPPILLLLAKKMLGAPKR